MCERRYYIAFFAINEHVYIFLSIQSISPVWHNTGLFLEKILEIRTSGYSAEWPQHLNENAADKAEGKTNLRAPSLGDTREVGKLKNNLTAGKKQLQGEGFKYGIEKLTSALHWIISRNWYDNVCQIYKKCYKLDCSNTRGIITRINAAYKVLSRFSSTVHHRWLNSSWIDTKRNLWRPSVYSSINNTSAETFPVWHPGQRNK